MQRSLASGDKAARILKKYGALQAELATGMHAGHVLDHGQRGIWRFTISDFRFK